MKEIVLADREGYPGPAVKGIFVGQVMRWQDKLWRWNGWRWTEWRRPLLVGQAPGKSYPNGPAFRGKTGARLTKLLGFEWSEMFDAVNLIPTYPGKVWSGKGDSFPNKLAKENAKRLLDQLTPRLLVLCGRQVANAFSLRLDKWPMFQEDKIVWHPRLASNTRKRSTDTKVFPAIVVPHPSGISQWWNDPSNVELMRLHLRRAAGLP